MMLHGLADVKNVYTSLLHTFALVYLMFSFYNFVGSRF